MRSKVGASTASMLTVTRCRPAAFSGVGERVEQMAVGGEGEVERLAGEGAQAGQLLDQFDEAAAQQGFAAGEADLGDAEGDEEADEAEVVFDGEFGILRAHFAGAAVDALVVAAVGNGDAEIVNDAAVAIGQAARGRIRGQD